MALLAFSAGDVAYWGLAVFLVAVGLASAYMLFRLGQAFGRLSSFIAGTERELLPVITKTGGTVDRVNYQLDKVDSDHRQRRLDGRQRRHGRARRLDGDRDARGEGLGPGRRASRTASRRCARTRTWATRCTRAGMPRRGATADLREDLRQAGRTRVETERPAAQAPPAPQPKPDPVAKPAAVRKPEPVPEPPDEQPPAAA